MQLALCHLKMLLALQYPRKRVRRVWSCDVINTEKEVHKGLAAIVYSSITSAHDVCLPCPLKYCLCRETYALGNPSWLEPLLPLGPSISVSVKHYLLGSEENNNFPLSLLLFFSPVHLIIF